MKTNQTRPGRLAVLLAGLIGLAGCGAGSGGPVQGKVSYQGKPVVWGSITLIASDRQAYGGMIETDGSFRIEGVPRGPVKVGVVSPDPQKKLPSNPRLGGSEGRPVRQAPADDRPRPPKGAWFPLPDKFSDPMTSGVTAEVVRGQRLDIDLK